MKNPLGEALQQHTESHEISALADRYWRLAAASANEEIANGLAALEMVQILHKVHLMTQREPCSEMRRCTPDDCDIAMSNTAVLAENLWRESIRQFGADNTYFPPGYEEVRDQLVDGTTQTLEIFDTENTDQGLRSREAISSGEIVFVCSGNRRVLVASYESKEIVDVPNVCERGQRFFPRRAFYNDPDAHFLVRPRNPDALFPNAICIGQEELSPWFGETRISDPSIKANIWLDPFITCPLRFLNHSCEPNMKRSADSVTFVATRDITSGEQLTCDYSTLEVNPDWSMNCHCGSDKCRGKIGGIQSLPVEALDTYGRDLPSFMLNLFRKSHPQVGHEVYCVLNTTRNILGIR